MVYLLYNHHTLHTSIIFLFMHPVSKTTLLLERTKTFFRKLVLYGKSWNELIKAKLVRLEQSSNKVETLHKSAKAFSHFQFVGANDFLKLKICWQMSLTLPDQNIKSNLILGGKIKGGKWNSRCIPLIFVSKCLGRACQTIVFEN